MTTLAAPRSRWGLYAGGGVVVIGLVAGAFALGSATTGTNDVSPVPVAPITTLVPDVRTELVAGVALPFSRIDGPRSTALGRAAGYSQSEKGAAFAAAQVLMRTSPSAGSRIADPVFASQMTGSNLAAMKLSFQDNYQQLRTTTSVPDGDPIPGADATIAGFVVTTYASTRASIDVVMTSPELDARGQLVVFAVQLVWQGEDWRVIAPPMGDWGTVVTALGSPPPGLLPYGG